MAGATVSPACRGCGGPVAMVWRGGPRAGYVRSGYFCSDECKPRCAVDGCEGSVRKRGWCANHYAVWHAHGTPDAEVKYQWANEGPCWTCGNADFTSWEIQSRKFCTHTCQVTWHKYGGAVPESFNCAICAVVVPYFDPITRGRLRSDAAYCRAHTRHARVSVTVQEIAAADGTLCRLCDAPVDMALRSPDRLSPSVDHVIPRARGGSDYRDNLQLSHRGCNSSKRHFYAG